MKKEFFWILEMGRESDKTRKKGKLSKVIHVSCLCSRSSCLRRDSAFEMFEYAKCLRGKNELLWYNCRMMRLLLWYNCRIMRLFLSYLASCIFRIRKWWNYAYALQCCKSVYLPQRGNCTFKNELFVSNSIHGEVNSFMLVFQYYLQLIKTNNLYLS